MSTTEIILWAVAVWIVYRFVSGVLEGFDKATSNDRVELLKRLDEIIHRVKIEKHGDVEYWFDLDNDKFLGQGTTKDEVVQALKGRFPKHIFVLDDLGGIGAHTDWKFVPVSEFKNIKINLDE